MYLQEEIERTAEIIKKGGVVLYPTDTIWGLGCDIRNVQAIKRIYKIKRRTEAKSLIVLVSEIDCIAKYVDNPNPIAYDLINEWKKPLTIVYPNPKNLPSLLIKEDNTVAIRVTTDEFSMKLIKAVGAPIISTSANISGEPTPLNFRSIRKELLGEVDYVVNFRRETLKEMKSSTIIKLSSDNNFEVLRP